MCVSFVFSSFKAALHWTMAWSINIIAPNVGVFFCLRVRSSSCALTSIFLSFSSSVIYSFLNSSYHLQDQLSSLLLEACRPDPRSQVLSARSSVSAQQDQGSGANCYQTYFTARWSDQQAFIRCDQFTYRKFLRHFYSTATYWSQISDQTQWLPYGDYLAHTIGSCQELVH